MLSQNNTDIIKQVGANGQVSLGKKYANKQIQISQLDDSTIMIKLGKFIPNNEQWLYNGDNLDILREAVKEAKNREPQNNFEEIMISLERVIKND
jgi:ABC-type oligopeptide transport system substrate-binding subunit